MDVNEFLLNQNEEDIELDKVVTCPVWFENHSYGGNIARIENFTNIHFGDIRTTVVNGKPYFANIDICRAIGLNQNYSTQSIKRKIKKMSNTPTKHFACQGMELYYYIPTNVITGTKKDGTPAIQSIKMMYISEALLYMLIFQSEKPEALEFQWWICNDVLPNMSYLGREGSIKALTDEIAKNRQQIDFLTHKIADTENSLNEFKNININLNREIANDKTAIRYKDMVINDANNALFGRDCTIADLTNKTMAMDAELSQLRQILQRSQHTESMLMEILAYIKGENRYPANLDYSIIVQ